MDDSDEFDEAGRVPENLLRLAEAVVFASPEPVTGRALAPLLPEVANAYIVLEALPARCAERGVVLAEVGGGWQFRTAPDLALRLRPALAPPHKRLPRAAVEVLATIALYQPITRGEVEQARGVSVGQATMDLLLGAGLIKPCGREFAPGRPTLWATTPRFLAQYGLRSLWELPGAGPRRPRRGRAGRRPSWTPIPAWTTPAWTTGQARAEAPRRASVGAPHGVPAPVPTSDGMRASLVAQSDNAKDKAVLGIS